MLMLDQTHAQSLATLSMIITSMNTCPQSCTHGTADVLIKCMAHALHTCLIGMPSVVFMLAHRTRVRIKLCFLAMQAAEKAASEKKSKQAAATSAAAGSADTIEQRQKDARKWINDWRAR